jgi:hypothetical protein
MASGEDALHGLGGELLIGPYKGVRNRFRVLRQDACPAAKKGFLTPFSAPQRTRGEFPCFGEPYTHDEQHGVSPAADPKTK